MERKLMADVIELDNETFIETKVVVNYWKKTTDFMAEAEHKTALRESRKKIIQLLKNTAERSGTFMLRNDLPNIKEEIEVHWRMLKPKRLYQK
jgi:galactokinase/mevalonate kinase-like predicted kinase